METNSLKALALKVLQGNTKGNIKETSDILQGNIKETSPETQFTPNEWSLVKRLDKDEIRKLIEIKKEILSAGFPMARVTEVITE